ncbi:MAG: phosphoribosylamine--glycine ligase [Treponema sp.]|nr:phosphoribosylamine--glycine ligase [Treponema sp.]
MNMLVIGSGGREHAMAWKLAQSEKVAKVYAAPGNGGTAAEEKCENAAVGLNPAEAEGQEALIAFAKEHRIEVTVVGPEAPLAAGIADRFRQAGLAVAGPGAGAARLEASKVYSKKFMKKYGVRAAASRDFNEASPALDYVRRHFARPRAKPLVIKADGLAAGKGVVIAGGLDVAEQTIGAFMRDKSLGPAGASVVLEDFLAGEEVSVMAAVNVRPGVKGTIMPFIAARDHKSRLEGGAGPNTGGMGAIAPVPGFSEALQEDFAASILQPTLRGIRAEAMDYRGFIFFGLMIQGGQCWLLEYNVRLGDPETQALLPLLDSDFAELCRAVAGEDPALPPLAWKPGAACAPVAVAEGYPGPYRRGDPVSLNEALLTKHGAKLFIAGARRGPGGPAGSGLRTDGGRVLSVCALGSGGEEARRRAYAALGAVSFTGMGFRRDIGLTGEG